MTQPEPEWFEDEDDYEPECRRCWDSGLVVAMDGFHEYLGYSHVPCNCRNARVPNPPSNPYEWPLPGLSEDFMKEKPTESKIKKLPRWAQDYIRAVEEERNEAQMACDGQTPSRIFTGLLHGWKEPIGFVQNDRVYFRRATVDLTYTFEVVSKNGDIEIRCRDGHLIVLPGCSNQVTIRQAD